MAGPTLTVTQRLWRFLIAAAFAFALLPLVDQATPARAAMRSTPCPPTLFGQQPPVTSGPCAALPALAATLPANFQESVIFNGLTNPTAIRFLPDGRVFVAEKSGFIKVFASLTATAPTIFADLRSEVDDYWDRGLLGLELDPNYPATPYVYALYTFDAPISGAAPTWNDACPTPPGPTTDGCLVSGRLSRLRADATGNTMAVGGEQVLLNDWCQQFPSHSIGDLHFGPDGALYVSGGDGASFNNVDYGQYGNTYTGDQRNPCGDPPAGVGGAETPPTAEGGSLRSQSLGRGAGEPALLNGAILRVDPATGNGLPTNPFYSSSDPNARRIIASGLRNPFRFAIRPGGNEIWVDDVGWNTWEEINRIPIPTAAPIKNFGWPCYEGAAPQSGYQSANLTLCNNLYNAAGSVTPPYYTYNHSAKITPSETCSTGSSSVTGSAFYTGASYPAAYNGALFFADHSRNCIWVMFRGANGDPNPDSIAAFVQSAAHPVDLEIGPNGDLFYVDFDGGAVRRIQYFPACQPPNAVATASPTTGPAPLTVSFDGSGSSDPNPGGSVTMYSWDLNGDGVFGDATGAQTNYTYTAAGTYTARLQVTNNCGASSVSNPLTITPGNTAPSATILTPSSSLTWKVGDVINFSGSATDAQDGTLPASALTWAIILHHCPSDCHTHTIQTFAGVASGSFTAPDHEYPSYLEIQLTATDAGGLTNTASVQLNPQTVTLTFQSNPSGLQLSVGAGGGITPYTRTVIVGSSNTISALSPQTVSGTTYQFSSWSDGGTSTHTITAPAAPATYTAHFEIALVGDLTVGTNTDGNRAGVAEAFQYTASASGSLNRIAIYVDGNNKSNKIIVGVYSNTASDAPGSLLTQATITNPVVGAWNSVTVPMIGVTSGQKYWIAALGAAGGGPLRFRDIASGGRSQTYAGANLTALPATWKTGKVTANTPMSAYATQVF